MDLRKYINEIKVERDNTRIFEKSGVCAKFCINQLNALVVQKTNGARELQLSKELNTLYQQLFAYLNNDERIDDVEIPLLGQRWSRDKGVLFIGEYGSGKTLLLDFLGKVKGQFKIEGKHTNAFEICKEYQYAQQNPKYEAYEQLLNAGCLFIDEVGDEPKVSKSYGNEENVIYRTLKTKFDKIENQQKKDKVFMTSNLGADEFKERYGERLWDRIKGNMNIIVIGAGDKHKSHRK